MRLGRDSGGRGRGHGRALEDTHLAGLGHNVPFLAAVMDQDRVKSGELSTSYIKDEFPDGFNGLRPTQTQERILIASALAMHEVIAEQDGDPSDRTDWIVMIDKTPHGVSLSYDEDEEMILTLTGGGDIRLSDIDWRPGLAQFKADLDGEAFTAEVRRVADGFDIRHRAARARVRVLRPEIAQMYARLRRRRWRTHRNWCCRRCRVWWCRSRWSWAKRSRPARPWPSSRP